jgi:putative ABC transport system ATP-binding protein
MNNDIMLKVERLTQSYPGASGPLTVLREVSFELNAGASLAIVGPSGSGKTTLLGLCAGLDLPSGGSVTVAGELLDGLDEDARAAVRNRHVGFVFQNFQLIPTLTALENVLVPLELRGESGRENEARTLLERVGLGQRADHYPVQLSGGEQQRVALARAVALQPRYIIYDEPTSGLDPETSNTIDELIRNLADRLNVTSIVVTHDMHSVLNIADRAAFIYEGRVHWTGTIEELHHSDDQILKAFVTANEYKIGPS